MRLSNLFSPMKQKRHCLALHRCYPSVWIWHVTWAWRTLYLSRHPCTDKFSLINRPLFHFLPVPFYVQIPFGVDVYLNELIICHSDWSYSYRPVQVYLLAKCKVSLYIFRWHIGINKVGIPADQKSPKWRSTGNIWNLAYWISDSLLYWEISHTHLSYEQV